MSLQNFMGGGKASDLAFLFSDVATDVESLNGIQLSSGTPLGVVVGSVISKIVISTALATLGITCTLLLVLGLPEKQKRHIQSGLPKGVYSFSVGVVGFVYLSTETYVPSLPQMELDLQGSQTLLSGTVQINLLMKALGCFIIAPLSDRIGRRPAMLTCLALATLTSFSCMLATHISWFFLARILQGLSEACECLVFAIIRDFCDDTEERYQVLSSIWIATIFANMSAPLIGGVIAIFSSWRFGFLLLVVSWGGLFLFAYLKLPESAPDEARSSLLQDLATCTGDWHQDCLIIAEGLFYSCYFSFLANVSFVMEVNYNQGLPVTCAVIASTMVSLWVACKTLNRLLDGPVIHIAQGSVLVAMLAVLADCLAGLVYDGTCIWAYLVPSAIQVSLMGVPIMSLPTLYMDPLEKVAGLAACMEVVACGFLSSIFSALSTQALLRGGQAGLVLFEAMVTLTAGVVFWLGQGVWRPMEPSPLSLPLLAPEWNGNGVVR